MSLVDSLRFAYTCPLAWEKLTEVGAATRHCDSCQQTVTDLSAMGPAQAAAYLQEQTSSVCVRIARDSQGRALHRSRLAIATAAVLAVGCAAPGSDTGDTATTFDTASDTADTAEEAENPAGSASRGGKHRRPVGTGLGTGEEQEPAEEEPPSDLEIFLEVLNSKVIEVQAQAIELVAPRPAVVEPEEVYITMGIMIPWEPPTPPSAEPAK